MRAPPANRLGCASRDHDFHSYDSTRYYWSIDTTTVSIERTARNAVAGRYRTRVPVRVLTRPHRRGGGCAARLKHFLH